MSQETELKSERSDGDERGFLWTLNAARLLFYFFFSYNLQTAESQLDGKYKKKAQIVWVLYPEFKTLGLVVPSDCSSNANPVDHNANAVDNHLTHS